MIGKISEWISVVVSFIASLSLWIKITVPAVTILIIFIIVATILKKKKNRRIAFERLRRMEELDAAISNKKKGA